MIGASRFLWILAILLIQSLCVSAQGNAPRIIDWSRLEPDDSLVFEHANMNSAGDDYAPVFAVGQHVYFTSDRKNGHTKESVFDYNEEVYVASLIGTTCNGASSKYFFNSDDHTAIAGASTDGLQLFLYKTFSNGDLYRSLNKDGQWNVPQPMKGVNTTGHEQSIAVSGSLTVISAEREGGLGGHDLYMADFSDAGTNVSWIPFAMANTAGEEVDVRLSPDGKRLWFASDGRSDSKGFDIFVCEKDSLGRWKSPVRLDAPINSNYNDRWFYDAGERFAMSSDRPEGNGGDDIYLGWLYPRDTMQVFDLAYAMSMDTLFLLHLTKNGTAVKDSTNNGSDRYTNIANYMESAGISSFYAMVQIGAYYGLSIAKFKSAYPSLRNTEVVTETAIKPNGGKITRFLVSTKFTTLKDAALMQETMINTHHIRDAFVAVYNLNGERVAIYNTLSGTFVLLKEGATPKNF